MKAGIRLIAFALVIVFVIALSNSTRSSGKSAQDYCTDGAGVLSESTRDYITERNYNLESNCSGAQIFVVVVGSTGSQKITEYASDLFTKKRIGSADEDNGVLILMVTDDRDYMIVRGKGLDKVLDSAVLTEICRERIEPYFGDRDYDTAVRETFKRLNECICTHYGADPYGFASSGNASSSGSGRPGGGVRGGCTGLDFSIGDIDFGKLTFAACTACVGIELLTSIGGEN